MATNSNDGANTGANPLLEQAEIVQHENLGQQILVDQIQLKTETDSDLLAQLTQLSTSNSVGKVQQSIQQLTSSLQSNQALQASALVGRKILVNSSIINLGQEGGIIIAVDLTVGVSELTASIYSESNDLIKIMPLKRQEIGLFEFSWDGLNQKGERLSAGKYRIKVNGIYFGDELTLNTMISANVDSVDLGHNNDGVKLNIAGIGSVSLNDVKHIIG